MHQQIPPFLVEKIRVDCKSPNFLRAFSSLSRRKSDRSLALKALKKSKEIPQALVLEREKVWLSQMTLSPSPLLTTSPSSLLTTLISALDIKSLTVENWTSIPISTKSRGKRENQKNYTKYVFLHPKYFSRKKVGQSAQ